jgi:hypothetical protein
MPPHDDGQLQEQHTTPRAAPAEGFFIARGSRPGHRPMPVVYEQAPNATPEQVRRALRRVHELLFDCPSATTEEPPASGEAITLDR